MSAQPVAVRDAEGRLVVAWGASSGVASRRLAAGRWEDLPLVASPVENGYSPAPALSLDRLNRPLVYFFERERIRVLRLEGSSWNDLSPRAAPPRRRLEPPFTKGVITCPAVVTMTASPSLAVDGDGRPAVAWAEPGPERMRAVVHRFTGAAWVTSISPDIGPTDLCAPHSMRVGLSLDPQGKPLITFRSDRALKGLFFSGGRFRDSFTSIPHDDVLYTHEIHAAFDPAGKLWIASSERASEGQKLVDRVRVSRADGATFLDVPSPPDRPLRGQILAFQAGARPAIALYDKPSGAPQVRVVSFDPDGAHERTGSPEESVWRGTAGASWPSVVLPSAEASPAFVYRVSAFGDTAIVAQQWAPGGFRGLGETGADDFSIGEGTNEGVPPAIAMRDGRVAVAFRDGDSPSIAVRLWDGCSFRALPPIVLPDLSNGLARAPSIALDSSGRPLVAWSSSVVRLRGDTWEKIELTGLPGAGIPRGQFFYGLVLGPDDAPSLGIAAVDGSAVASLIDHAFRPEGNYFAPLGTLPALVSDAAGRPVSGTLEWKDRSAFVMYTRRLEGARWVDLPPWKSPATSQSGFPPERLAVAAGADGRVAFAFRRSVAEPASLAEWNGSSWTNLPAIDPGGHPSLVYDASNKLLVAWSDRSSGEIFVKRLDAGVFVDVGGASAPLGISASEARSVDPVIASAGGVVCVVWSEARVGRGRVLLRCHHE